MIVAVYRYLELQIRLYIKLHLLDESPLATYTRAFNFKTSNTRFLKRNQMPELAPWIY